MGEWRMPDGGSGDTSRQGFQVAYHGDRLDDHSLDVEALAPALLGFGRLVRESNSLLNGDKVRVKILVTSDFEHKCFHINFEVVQTAIEKVKTFLQDDHVKTVKQLLQTIGVIRSSGVGSLLDYLKWKRNKPAEKIEVVPTLTPTSPGLITIQIIGDSNTITITPEVLKLAENPRVLEAVKETLAPVEMKEATRIEFRDNNQPVASIDFNEARDIVREIDYVPEVLEAVEDQATPDTVVATLHVYSPVFDEKAKRWRFVYKRNKHIYADISETSIASDAIKRGGSFVNDRYRVRMEVTPPDIDDGEPHYKIIAVLEFTPAPQQGNLALPKPRGKRSAKKAAKKKAK
jgi:hypothetical protein